MHGTASPTQIGCHVLFGKEGFHLADRLGGIQFVVVIGEAQRNLDAVFLNINSTGGVDICHGKFISREYRFPREPKGPVNGMEAPSSINSGAGGFGASVPGGSVSCRGLPVAGASVGAGAGVGAGAQLAINTLIKSTIVIKLVNLAFIAHPP